ncbi:MAG TPA: hypothetical protein VMG08_11790 [Allosphingosinicella sp.]|nr:hypothetical protein [Allosphingosinicella sp.]
MLAFLIPTRPAHWRYVPAYQIDSSCKGETARCGAPDPEKLDPTALASALETTGGYARYKLRASIAGSQAATAAVPQRKEKKMQREYQDDLVVLGVATTDTQGEPMGFPPEAVGFFRLGLSDR